MARLEIHKFQAQSYAAVRDEYEKYKDERHTRLHLDHVPVIDEDGQSIDYAEEIAECLELGYESVMVDGSRLGFEENIAATKRIVEIARGYGRPVEGELGAVIGHEAGPMPPYEELFAGGKGFTDAGEAGEFVRRTGLDWLSVAIGNFHGAVAPGKRDDKKMAARLNIEHLRTLREAAKVPLVLHGGSGIQKEYLREAFRAGIAKCGDEYPAALRARRGRICREGKRGSVRRHAGRNPKRTGCRRHRREALRLIYTLRRSLSRLCLL